MILILCVLAFVSLCSRYTCDKDDCVTNQMDFNREYFVNDFPGLAYSFWYKYHLFTSQQQLRFNIFTSYQEVQVKPVYSYTININNTVAIHDFICDNTTFWDQQFIQEVKEDQDVWHFFVMYIENGKLMIQITFKDQIFLGINHKMYFYQLSIEYFEFRQDLLIVLCDRQITQGQIESKTISLLQQCNDRLEQNITIQYQYEMSRYMTEYFNQIGAQLYIWLKDESSSAKLDLYLSVIQEFQRQDLFVIHKHEQNITLIIQNWDRTNKISDLHIISEKELYQWYLLLFDHSRFLIVKTIVQQYKIELQSFQVFPQVQLELIIESLIFSQFTISSLNLKQCPPNCEVCNGMTCNKCNGNRIGSDCQCPPGQKDFGLGSCEYPYLKFDVQIINIHDEQCPIGYLKCTQSDIMCDQYYIKYKETCIKCPHLGTEICKDCLINNQLMDDQLTCRYTNTFNLRRFKQYQIEEYMVFQYGGSYKLERKEFNEINSTSVQISYQILNHSLEPIITQSTLQVITCPYNYQLLNVEYSPFDLCLKLPKYCLQLTVEGMIYKCIQCRKGYSYINDVCIKCPQNCKSCNNQKCISCYEGYYLSLDGSCRLCTIAFCKACYEYNDGLLSLNYDFRYGLQQQLCALCDQDLEFNYQIYKCQPKLLSNCELSILNTKSLCLVQNIDNFDTISTICQIKNCIQCYQKQCIICRPGFYLDKLECKQCLANIYLFISNENQITCQPIDIINESHRNYILQHIFVYHFQAIYQQSLFPIQVTGCMNNQIQYDIFLCQPKDNEYTDSQIRYCLKYILSKLGKPYCIESQKQSNKFVINRISGSVSYCGGYHTCSRVANYHLEMRQNHKGYQYNGQFYQSIQYFIESLNKSLILMDQVQEINIFYQQIGKYHEVVNQLRDISINLMITIRYFKSIQFEHENRMEIISNIKLLYFNTIRIDYFFGSHHNEFSCNNLLIDYFIQSYTYNQIVNYHTQINSTKLTIQNISITNELNNNKILMLQGQTMIHFDHVFINHKCSNSVYFYIIDKQNLTLRIAHLYIFESVLQNCTLVTIAENYHLEILNLTIINSTINQSQLISCSSLQIDYSSISISRIDNSQLFLTTGKLNITKFQIMNCEITNSRLVIVRYICYINSLQVIHSFMINTQMIVSEGLSIVLEHMKLLQLVSSSAIKNQALIQIKSHLTNITDMYTYLYYGNTSVLRIQSQTVYLNRLILKNQIESYLVGELDKQCQLNLLFKEQNTFIILLEYTQLEFINSLFLNMYTTAPLITGQSSQSQNLTINNLTFNNIQTFSTDLIVIDASACFLNFIVFVDIFIHNVNLNYLSKYFILRIASVNLMVTSLYFIRIQNKNIQQLIWFNIISDVVHLKGMVFIPLQISISNLIKYNINDSAQKNYLDLSSGDYQLININAISVTFETLSIKNVTNTSNYLIQVNSNRPIQVFNLSILHLSTYTNFCKGFIQINSIVDHAYIVNLDVANLCVLEYIFDIKIRKSIVISDLRIKLFKSGGLFSCNLIGPLARLQIINLKVRLNTIRYLKGYYAPLVHTRALFNILNGQIMMFNVTVDQVLGDVLYIENAVNVTLINILMKNGQYLDNLILIKSLHVFTLKISSMEVKNYYVNNNLKFITLAQQGFHENYCWSGSFSFQQFSNQVFTPNYISLMTIILDNDKEQLILLESIKISNNSNHQQLIRLQNVHQPIIINLTIIKNQCSKACITLNYVNQAQIGTQQDHKNYAQYINSYFVKNTGILLDTQGSSITLISSMINHKGIILQNLTKNVFIQLNDSLMIQSSSQLNNHIMNNNDQQILNNELYLALSFDGGATAYPTVNGCVIFNNKSFKQFKYCNFPTGQTLGDYQRLSFSEVKYIQYIKSMRIIMKGYNSNQDQNCTLQFQNNTVTFQLQSQNWHQFKLIHNPKNKSFIPCLVKCLDIRLEFQIQILECQLGEIQVKDQCIRCPIYQYSVAPHAIKCLYINEFINESQSGLIQIKLGYWRPYFRNDQIEKCQNNSCLGGWNVGDQMCRTGYTGALCQECDLYSIRGNGKYSKQSNECELCRSSLESYIYFSLTLILQFVLMHSTFSSWNDNNQRMRSLRLFKSRQFLRLYKYQIGINIISIDQMQNLNEITNNIIQIFLIIESSSKAIPNLLKNIFESYSNPSINMQSIFQCSLTYYLTQDQFLYSKSIVSVSLYIILINLQLLKYSLQIIFTQAQYQFKFVLLILNQMLLQNLTNLAQLIIKLVTWSSISGIKWINEDKSMEYQSQSHYFYLISIILPQALFIFGVTPVIYYVLLKKAYLELLNNKFWEKWGYCYQNYSYGFQNWFLVIILVRILIILIINISNNQYMYFLLILILIIFNQWLQLSRPYVFEKFNKLIVQLTNILVVVVIQYGILNYCYQNQQGLVIIIQVIIAFLLGYCFQIIFSNFISILKVEIIKLLDKLKDAKFFKPIALNKFIREIHETNSNRVSRIQLTLGKMKTKTIFSTRLSQTGDLQYTSLFQQLGQPNISRTGESYREQNVIANNKN